MNMIGEVLLELVIIFILVVLAPLISRITRLPVIVVEILLGMALGPGLFNLLTESHTISIMALIGFIYLMFLAGLEVEIALLKSRFRDILAIALSSFLVPLTLGYLVALRYGLPPAFIGVALSTTSMGIVLPLVRELKGKDEVGQVLLGSAILVDVISMLALVYVVEERFLSPDKLFTFLSTFTAFILIVAYVREYKGLWKQRLAESKVSKFCKSYHMDVRLAIALIFFFALVAEFIGIHAILGSFFAGLLMSELRDHAEDLIKKLESFGYGFFIPIFFISVGVKTDLQYILSNIAGIELLAALLAVGFLGKLVGAASVSKAVGFTTTESLSIGFAMSARLSLIIAAAEVGLAVGFINREIYSILILLAIISTILSPTLAKMLASENKGKSK